jgi:hypothetical protein
MGFECLVELWALDVWWISGLWMFGGSMGFVYLVELWALDVWWSYGLWMFGGAMGLGFFVELYALDVWWSYGLWKFCFPEIKCEIIEKERKLSITTDHILNNSE